MNKKIVLFLIGILALATFVSAASVTLYPNGPGYYNQWIYSNTTGCHIFTAPEHWGCVDETTSDGDGTYLRTAVFYPTYVPFDTFQMADMTGTPTISKVTVSYKAKALNSVGSYLYPVLRDGNLTTEYIESSGWELTSTSSWNTFQKTYTTNPMTGSSWTKNEVNALQVGMKCPNILGTSKYCAVTQIYTRVVYS